MKIENIIDVITYSVLYYYSLIKRFNITDTLISGVKNSILLMWEEYMSDVEDEENIDLIGVMFNEHSEILYAKDTNLFEKITHVIISYFDKGNDIDTNMDILEIYQYPYLPGMVLNHAQISKIVEFYLNQWMNVNGI